MLWYINIIKDTLQVRNLKQVPQQLFLAYWFLSLYLICYAETAIFLYKKKSWFGNVELLEMCYLGICKLNMSEY